MDAPASIEYVVNAFTFPVPRKVLLFSGHMIDAPARPSLRFPADKTPLAAAAIAASMEELDAGANDLAICGGASGGDVLFVEAALARHQEALDI